MHELQLKEVSHQHVVKSLTVTDYNKSISPSHNTQTITRRLLRILETLSVCKFAFLLKCLQASNTHGCRLQIITSTQYSVTPQRYCRYLLRYVTYCCTWEGLSDGLYGFFSLWILCIFFVVGSISEDSFQYEYWQLSFNWIFEIFSPTLIFFFFEENCMSETLKYVNNSRCSQLWTNNYKKEITFNNS